MGDGANDSEPFTIFNRNQKKQMPKGSVVPVKPKAKAPIEGELTKLVKRGIKAVRTVTGN